MALSCRPFISLGYVLNVIERATERTETIRSAWQLAKQLLIVSARLTFEAKGNLTPFADGFLTGSSTFQKYYEQQELLDQLRPDNLDPLIKLAGVPVTHSYLRLDIWECRSCNETSALQVKFVAHSVDDNGDPHEETKDLSEVWSVMPRTLEKLKALLG